MVFQELMSIPDIISEIERHVGDIMQADDESPKLLSG